MRIRAGVILIKDDRIALIKRVKRGQTYYVIPGGGLDDGEYSDEAALREVYEELGIAVALERLVAIVERVEWGEVSHLQLYYLAEKWRGVFGSGRGEEFERSHAENSYEPTWLSLDDLVDKRTYPSSLIDVIVKDGLPEAILHLREPNDYPK